MNIIDRIKQFLTYKKSEKEIKQLKKEVDENKAKGHQIAQYLSYRR